MLRRFYFLLGLALLASLLRAATPLDNARRALALLGEGVWSQVIEIENAAAAGGARYPSVVHALVFEFEGILWFYTDADGTQSFSLHRGRLAAEKADFAPLLREIEPGFCRWTVLPSLAPGGAVPAETEPLKNGCFIESVAALRARVAEGRPIRAPRLLSYYVNHGGARVGHTVLAYEAEGRVEIFDPGRPATRFSFPLRAAREPLALARALERHPIAHARFLALESQVVAG